MYPKTNHSKLGIHPNSNIHEETIFGWARPEICILERPSIWPQKPVIQACHRRDFRLET